VRREWAYFLVIVAAAFSVRVYAPWTAVFAADRIDFLETDAWYHVRLIENQVRNWPWRITLDPYAAPGGQFVPIAPFFDTITATAVVIAHGRDADTAQIERIAVFIPPVLGTLTVIVVWALGRRVFDRRAGLLGAALLAILPGHFLDRTLLGFYDHHALEAFLAMATLLAFAFALEKTGLKSGPYERDAETDTNDVRKGRSLDRPTFAGVVLGLYLLGWSSGAFLVAILALWLVLLIPLSKTAPDLSNAARVSGVAAVVALVMVIVFQSPQMYRYGSQVVALVGLAAIALAIRVVVGRFALRPPRTGAVFGAVAIVAIVAGVVMWWVSPGLVTQLLADVRRLAPDPRRMAVLEARPLFLYPGTFHWQQPWEFFRTGFFIGVVALIVFAIRVWRERRAIDLLIWLFTAAMFSATLGQNRFGYYLVPACALVGGWLATRVLDWGGVTHAPELAPDAPRRLPLQREAAIVIVVAMFAPNLLPAVLVAARTGSLPPYWHDTMLWIRDHTPAPFANAANAGEEFYYARYPRDAVPPPDYSVMTWWDHGYWVSQIARRVPVANPTQQRAPSAGRFYASTDEAQASEALLHERARYVVIDWELPFRLTGDGSVMGRFQSVLDWAGAEHAKYYQVFYKWEGTSWRPVWVFHEPYYRSMTHRLMVMGGRAAVPNGSTTVLVVVDRTDDSGLRFAEIVSQTSYATYAAAVEAAKTPPPTGRAVIVGLDPWRPAFPVEPLTSLREVHATRTEGQKPNEAPWVRVFELR
jgi:oligosaccharyl transferase (archaeosortase A-associated)